MQTTKIVLMNQADVVIGMASVQLDRDRMKMIGLFDQCGAPINLGQNVLSYIPRRGVAVLEPHP